MKRNLGQLENRTFDLAVIGGGIIGACIVRDAARRGLSAALIEMNDFACAASEAMSHTIHGGIRYLAQGRIGMVREALAEKAVWLETAPDFVSSQKFIIPLSGAFSALKLKAGTALYQRLGGRRAVFLSAAEALEREPCLAQPGLSGAAVYEDARIDAPERLIIAILQDAAASGAVIANHVECVGLRTSQAKASGVDARDQISGALLHVRASRIVNASGPWAERLASRLVPGQKQTRLTPSQGIHILTPPISGSFAIAVSGKGEHGFVMPWMGMSLVGTTDRVFAGDAGAARASEAEIASLVEKMTRLLPSARHQLQNPLASFAGVRALPGFAGNTYRASREVAVCDHAADGAGGFYSVFGGKWTTARLIAERLIDRLAPKFQRGVKECGTRRVRIKAAAAPPDLGARLSQAAASEMAVTEDDFCRRIGRADMIASPGIHQDIKAWLASRDVSRDTVAVQSTREPP